MRAGAEASCDTSMLMERVNMGAGSENSSAFDLVSPSSLVLARLSGRDALGDALTGDDTDVGTTN